jgi:hypothetical protein
VQGNSPRLQSRALGLGAITAVDPRAAGAADISFVANDVDMAIDALGLKGKAEHTTDETADLRLLPGRSNARRYFSIGSCTRLS